MGDIEYDYSSLASYKFTYISSGSRSDLIVSVLESGAVVVPAVGA